jgi:NADP-dependent 3-hydroxy acid dehydrogenase YdfG
MNRSEGRLKDKVAIVTGASSGIGEATAVALAGEGARVVAVARRGDRLRALVRRIAEAGGEALAVEADVAQEDGVHRMIEAARTSFGRIDILINNAGVMLNGPLEKVGSADFRRMVDLNLMGIVYACQAVLPLLREQGGGNIVNISSVASRIAGPGSAVYAATKAAVNVFSESLRKETFKDHIRVTVIEPGVVATELADHIPDPVTKKGFEELTSAMTPLQPEDLAAAILYAVTQPAHVAVNILVVRPTEQER